MTTRIVVLTASSGGGHNAAASALEALISKRLHSKCEFIRIDIYENGLFQRLPMLAKIRYHSDSFWRLFLGMTNNKLVSTFIAKIMRPYMIRKISKQLPEQCDLLLAVHFNPAHCLSILAKQFKTTPKTAIIATDFDPHWAWFGSGADAIYTLSAEGRAKALEVGYQNNQIYTLPLIPTEPIKYRQPTPLNRSRIRIGIVAGQDGSNPKHISKLLDMLASLPNANDKDITLFCGTNTQLQQRVQQQIDRYAPLNLVTVGYTENLKSLFHRYDLMLIRTSPGILSECVCAGVPVVGFDWSSHEQYQQRFIHQHEIGFASKALTELYDYLSSLLHQPNALLNLQNNVTKLRRKIDTDAMLNHLLHVGNTQHV